MEKEKHRKNLDEINKEIDSINKRTDSLNKEIETLKEKLGLTRELKKEEKDNIVQEFRELLARRDMTLENLVTKTQIYIENETGDKNILYKKEYNMEDIISKKSDLDNRFYKDLIGLLERYDILKDALMLYPLYSEKTLVISVANIIDDA